jgi:hypothetical protein
VATGSYDKADAFLASVPQDSEFMVPALLWRLKSAVMRGDRVLASSFCERLLALMDMEKLLNWMDLIHRSPVFKDKILLPSLDPGLLRAVEEQAQNYFEVQRARGDNPMTDPVPAQLAHPAPGAASP